MFGYPFPFSRKEETPSCPQAPKRYKIVAPGDQVYFVIPNPQGSKGYSVQLGYVDRIDYGPDRRSVYFVTPLCQDYPIALDATKICAREDRDRLSMLLANPLDCPPN